MFGELPKLFDRDFVVAFFLPAAVFVVASLGLLTGYNVFPGLLPLLKEDALKGATVVGVLAWVAGVLLLVMNFSVYRLLEGYGDYNPLKLLGRFQSRRYERLQEQIAKVEQELEGRKFVGDEEAVNELRWKQSGLRQEAAEWFPQKPDELLPTAFGNTLRAFEGYSVEMYGADAIVLWVRLLAVVPAEFREMMNAAKAQTDFWVNLWLISYVLLLEHLFLLAYYGQFRMWWVAALAAFIITVAPRRAKSAARGWGDFVKASFDLYLPDLRKKLELPSPADADEEKRQWGEISRQVIYHKAPKTPARMKVVNKQEVPERAVAASERK